MVEDVEEDKDCDEEMMPGKTKDPTAGGIAVDRRGKEQDRDSIHQGEEGEDQEDEYSTGEGDSQDEEAKMMEAMGLPVSFGNAYGRVSMPLLNIVGSVNYCSSVHVDGYVLKQNTAKYYHLQPSTTKYSNCIH